MSSDVRQYSGWWRRAWALVIDEVIIIVAIVAVVVIAFLAGGSRTSVVVGVGLIVLLTPTYFTYCHGRTGSTVGKHLLGIAVRDIDDGTSIGYGRAFGRWLGQALIGSLGAVLVVPPFLNLLWPIWDKRRQAWHDKMVSSGVFRVTGQRAPLAMAEISDRPAAEPGPRYGVPGASPAQPPPPRDVAISPSVQAPAEPREPTGQAPPVWAQPGPSQRPGKGQSVVGVKTLVVIAGLAAIVVGLVVWLVLSSSRI